LRSLPAKNAAAFSNPSFGLIDLCSEASNDLGSQ
jgi:hypothetical protein